MDLSGLNRQRVDDAGQPPWAGSKKPFHRVIGVKNRVTVADRQHGKRQRIRCTRGLSVLAAFVDTPKVVAIGDLHDGQAKVAASRHYILFRGAIDVCFGLQAEQHSLGVGECGVEGCGKRLFKQVPERACAAGLLNRISPSVSVRKAGSRSWAISVLIAFSHIAA